MTSTDKLSLPSNKNTPFRGSNRPIVTVNRRLQEADLNQCRFIRLQQGSKAPIDHTPFSFDDVNDSYGVYAGKGLVLIDIDDYRTEASVPDALEQLPETFTVQTPHGGTHRYYSVEDPIPNSRLSWGEIRANNQYVVGPGTELDSCSKRDHDCSHSGEGRYRICKNQPITQLNTEALDPFIRSNEDDEKESKRLLVPTIEDQYECTADFDIDKRLEKMKKSEKGDKITALWEGRYRSAGFNDRSRAEASLVAYLGWWMQGDQNLVSQLMDRSCKEYPKADVNGLRKWREAGDLYRCLTLRFAEHSTYYQPPQSKRPFDERPLTSSITRSRVYGALLDLGIARTTELVEHDRVDRKRKQVNRVLDLFIQDGAVEWHKDGRNTYYYLSGCESLIPEEKCREIQLDF